MPMRCLDWNVFLLCFFKGVGLFAKEVCRAGEPQQNESEHGPWCQGLGLWLQPPALHSWSKSHENRYRDGDIPLKLTQKGCLSMFMNWCIILTSFACSSQRLLVLVVFHSFWCGTGSDTWGWQHSSHPDLPGGHRTQRHAASYGIIWRWSALPEWKDQQVCWVSLHLV